jgi:hypothetical protein
MRTALNMWVKTPSEQNGDGWSLFDADAWRAMSVPDLPMPKALSLGVCVVDRQWALTACQATSTVPVLDMVATGVGIDNVVAEVVRVLDRGVKATIAIDPSTTAGTVLADLLDLAALRPHDLEVRKLGRRESMQACMRLVEMTKGDTPRVGVLDSDILTAAAAAASRHGSMGELWEFSRSTVTAPIVAGALALATRTADTSSAYDDPEALVML